MSELTLSDPVDDTREKLSSELELLKNRFELGNADIALVHELVSVANRAGKCRDLIGWLAQHHSLSNTGLLAIISLLIDIDELAKARQVVDDAISLHSIYGDYLFHFSEYLIAQKQYVKSCQIMEWLCLYRRDDLKLHRMYLKTLYRLGDYKTHHLLSKQFNERFETELEFMLEDIRARIYRPHITRSDIHASKRDWAAQVRPLIPEAERPLPRKTNKVRVALVGEFLHPMFIEPLLRHYDRDAIDIEVFTNDERIQHIWDGESHPLPADDLEGVARKMRALNIDILIEMTARINELTLMSHRPAPLQGGWIGTNITQAFGFSDFVIADSVIIPIEERSDWSEQIVDLPVWAPFMFYDQVPDVEPCPSDKNGFITFGVCQRAMKYNDTFIGVWARLLAESPHSRLVLKDQSFADLQARNRMLKRCTLQGIDVSRLELEPGTPHPEYYDYYHRIDVSLDTFPHGGGILTAESLWMGVPVVTLTGDRFNSRLAHSYLDAIGAQDWVTQTPEAYIEKAIELADDIESRQRFREESRAKLQDSPIMQHETFARHWERTMQSLHQQHLKACEGLLKKNINPLS